MDTNVNTPDKIIPRQRDTHSNCLNVRDIHNQAGLEALSENNPAIFDGPINSAVQKDESDMVVSRGNDNAAISGKKWFVMRDLKRPNAKLPAYKLLEGKHIETFTPMKKVPVMRLGKKTYQEVPFIQDLLFVHSTAEELAPTLKKNPTLQYRYVRGKKYQDPMVVSDMEMEKFIQAVRTSESLRYYRPDELTAAMYGSKVRIIGGPLDNYEGCLLKGVRGKVLLVELQGFLSVGVEVSPEYIQFI